MFVNAARHACDSCGGSPSHPDEAPTYDFKTANSSFLLMFATGELCSTEDNLMTRKCSAFRRTTTIAAFLLSIFAVPSAVLAQDGYVVEGGFLSVGWNIWRKTAKYKMCRTTHGPNTAELLNNLTDEQYSILARDYPVVGIAGLKWRYSREQRQAVSKSATGWPESLDMNNFKRNGNYYDFPIVCLIGDISLVRQANTSLSAQPIIEPASSFKDKKGGEYLTAIYTGNFAKQSTLARQYLTEMSTSIGGAMAHLMGALAQTRDARIAKQELTVLEEVMSHYMTQYSRYGESCLSDGWFERRFTHELPDDVIFDDFGIEIDRIDGGTTTTVFKLNSEFAEACDNLCNTGGALVISAMTGNTMSQNRDYALGDVFRGVIEMLEDNNCGNPEVKQFEKSLLAMYAKERDVPSGNRNTLQNVLNSNR